MPQRKTKDNEGGSRTAGVSSQCSADFVGLGRPRVEVVADWCCGFLEFVTSPTS